MFADQVRDGIYCPFGVRTAMAVSSETFPTGPRMTWSLAGAVQESLGMFNVAQVGPGTVQDAQVGAGVLISGPDGAAVGPDQYVPYRLRGSAMVETPMKLVDFCLAIGPATVTANAAGDMVELAHFYGTRSFGDGFAACAVDEIVYLKPFGTIDAVDYSARALAFGVRVMNQAGTTETFRIAACGMIRRLDKGAPAVRDGRKQ